MRSTAVLALLVAACHQPLPASDENGAWMAQPLWNDGKTEIASYEGWVEEKDGRRHFSVTTQLAKPERSKVDFNIEVDHRSYAATISEPEPEHFPAVAVPLFVRTVSYEKMRQVDFSVVLIDGTSVDAMTELLDSDKDGERIAVYYAHGINSTFGPRTSKEIYVRGHDPLHTLLRVEDAEHRFGMALVKSERALRPVHP